MAGLSLSGTLTVDVGRCGLAQAPTNRTSETAVTLAGVTLTSTSRGQRDSERIGRGGDRVELGARVGAEALEVQLGVVLDPAHRDFQGLAIALVGLGALASGGDVGAVVGE